MKISIKVKDFSGTIEAEGRIFLIQDPKPIENKVSEECEYVLHRIRNWKLEKTVKVNMDNGQANCIARKDLWNACKGKIATSKDLWLAVEELSDREDIKIHKDITSTAKVKPSYILFKK